MNSLLCDSVGYIEFSDGRKWWGGSKRRKVVVFFEVSNEPSQGESECAYEAEMTIHAHTPYLGTNCSGVLTVLPNGSVHFTTEAKHVRFDGRCLPDKSGFEGEITIVGPENLNIENCPIRFGEIE